MAKTHWTEKEREKAQENTSTPSRGKTGSLPSGYQKGKKVTESGHYTNRG